MISNNKKEWWKFHITPSCPKLRKACCNIGPDNLWNTYSFKCIMKLSYKTIILYIIFINTKEVVHYCFVHYFLSYCWKKALSTLNSPIVGTMFNLELDLLLCYLELRYIFIILLCYEIQYLWIRLPEYQWLAKFLFSNNESKYSQLTKPT